MINRAQKPPQTQCLDPTTFLEQMNVFYSRFKQSVPQNNWTLTSTTFPQITVEKRNVTSIPARVDPQKASCLNGLKGRVLRGCLAQLGNVFTHLFQQLLDSSCFPQVWEESAIMPMPKRSNAGEMNNFRLVALTSTLCKCMERVLSDQLTTIVGDRLHQLQFAYETNRGVEDACLTLLATVSRHPDSLHPSTNFIYGFFISFYQSRLKQPLQLPSRTKGQPDTNPTDEGLLPGLASAFGGR